MNGLQLFDRTGNTAASVSVDGTAAHFDWPRIEALAAEPIKERPGFEHLNILMARMLIAAKSQLTGDPPHTIERLTVKDAAGNILYQEEK